MLIFIYRQYTNQKGKWTKNMNFNNIYMYKQRPKDEYESKGEKECRYFLETFFQLPFPKSRPDFLKNPITGHNLEIDCYNEHLKLGVEYNGSQHYKFSPYFHKNYDAAMNQKYRDVIKHKLCDDNNINLIIVPYTIKLNDVAKFLYLKLNNLGYTNRF